MKKTLKYILIILFILAGCHQPLPPELQNRPPGIPENIYPSDGEINIPSSFTLRWKITDPNLRDSLTYSVHLDTILNPGIYQTNLSVDTLQVLGLQLEKEYYWKIVASDQNGDSTSSPIWTFRTRYKNNHPPYQPASPVPDSSAVSVQINDITLQWSSGDPDTFSTVTYEIMFGEKFDSLSTIAENQLETRFSLPLLLYGRTYFWQIVARDNYDLSTQSPVWNFETQTATLLFEKNFDTDPINQNPVSNDWALMELPPADIYVTDETSWDNQGQCVCFVDTTEAGNSFLAAALPEKRVGMIQFFAKVSALTDYFGIRLYSNYSITPDSSHLGPQVSFRNGNLQFFSADENWETIMPVDINRWYFIQLVFDCENDQFAVYIDGELKFDLATWVGNSVSEIAYIYFLTFDNRTCQKAFVDEIRYVSGS